jgi:hypothetical protein
MDVAEGTIGTLAAVLEWAPLDGAQPGDTAGTPVKGV